METEKNIKQAVNSAEGLKSQLENFAKNTNDQEAAKMFKNLAQNVEQGAKQLKQYKGNQKKQ